MSWSSTYTLVTLIFISFLLCLTCGLGRVVFSLSSFSLALPAPWIDRCGRGGVREHPRERTSTGGIEPARHPPPEVVQVSADKDGAARPPWIPRNRPLAALAGAWTRSAAGWKLTLDSPTDCCDETSRLRIARLGSAMISNIDSMLFVYFTEHIRVKVYLGGKAQATVSVGVRGCTGEGEKLRACSSAGRAPALQVSRVNHISAASGVANAKTCGVTNLSKWTEVGPKALG